MLLDTLGDAVRLVDETCGFRYFDATDLLGFVDEAANPTGLDIPDAALASDEDQDAGGSYVVTQRYLHKLSAWKAVGSDAQEKSSA